MPTIASPDVTGHVFATDPDVGDQLHYSATAGNGTVTFNQSGDFTYHPSDAARTAARTTPTDTVTVTVTDNAGAMVEIPVTVKVVPATNAAPDFRAQQVGLPDPITGMVNGGAAAIDPDGDHVKYSASAGKGDVDINEDTGAFVYKPSDAARKVAGKPGAAGDALKDTVSVTATDEFGATSTINLRVDVEPAHNTVVDTITLASGPSNLVAGPNNTFYVRQGNSVVQINTVTGAVVRTVAIGFSPTDIAISADGSIFASDGVDTVKMFPAGGGQSADFGPFPGPTVLLTGPDGRAIYVANSSATVSVIDSATGQVAAQSTSTFGQITEMAVSPDGRTIFGVLGDGRIVVADVPSNTYVFVETAIEDPAMANLAVSASGKLYALDPSNDFVAVFTKQAGPYQAADIHSPGAPSDIAISSDASRVYIVNRLAGSVTVYNGSTNALVATIPIGGAPDEVEIDPTGTYLYVSDNTTKKVSIVRL